MSMMSSMGPMACPFSSMCWANLDLPYPYLKTHRCSRKQVLNELPVCPVYPLPRIPTWLQVPIQQIQIRPTPTRERTCHRPHGGRHGHPHCGFFWSICPEIGMFMQWHCTKISHYVFFLIFILFHYSFLSKPSVLHLCFWFCSQQSIWQHQTAHHLFVNSFLSVKASTSFLLHIKLA